MADNQIIFNVSANTKDAENAIESFGDKATDIGKKIGAGLAAYASFSFLKSAIESVTHAAMESDKAVRSFNNALALSGGYSKEASDSFIGFASSMEKITGIQDEVILNNAALLTSISHLRGEGLEKASKAALDLSKGLQIDVGSAFDIVTKASQGNVTALSKYGLEVNQRESDSQKFAKALEFIKQKFGGLAEGSVNTFEGSLSRMKNGFDDVLESIGKIITHSPKLAAIFKIIGDALYSLSESIANSGDTIDGFVDALFKIGSFLVTYVATPLEIISRVFITNFLMLPRIMLSVYAEAAGVIDKLFGTDLMAKVQPILDSVKSFQEAAAAPLISDDQLISTRLGNSIDATRIKVDALASTMDTAMNGTVIPPIVAATDYWKIFKDSVFEGTLEMAESVKKLGQIMKQNMVTGFNQAFGAMGKALVQGGNVMEAFGQVMLGMLGEIAMQFGAFFIAQGIGYIAGGNYGQGAALLVAGAAISVLGGAIKAMAGSGGGSGAQTASSSQPSNQTTTADFGGQQISEQERAQAQTGVQVVVQGNIFDSKETGLQIAQILNDSFDLNGTLIRANA